MVYLKDANLLFSCAQFRLEEYWLFSDFKMKSLLIASKVTNYTVAIVVGTQI
jgi:hypothetical protein